MTSFAARVNFFSNAFSGEWRCPTTVTPLFLGIGFSRQKQESGYIMSVINLKSAFSRPSRRSSADVVLTRRSRLAVACLCCSAMAYGQWDPNNGQWGKSVSTDVRVMTWNVRDGICSSNDKVEGVNNWNALVRIVAAMKPDVLLLQETGDNSGNGTGSGVDSVVNLTTTIDLFFHGGTDPFNGGSAITSWVQKYDPAFDMATVFVTTNSDGFNRNVILTRFALLDLNGNSQTTLNDIPSVQPDQYAPGGNGGIRGFQFMEIDLPDATYLGDLVVGGAHLKSGGSSSDLNARLVASQNVAYILDYWWNGAGTGIPDPNGKIIDFPAATTILGTSTPWIIGGDWNEDEATNGRRGPAAWLTEAAVSGGTDGTDRDRTDSTFDNALHFFTGSRNTLGSSKLDYIAWQDSIASLRRAFVFNTSGTPGASLPAELSGFPFAGGASSAASDHLPVIADFILPMQVNTSVIISEIMYNPNSDESLPTDVEWVEIYNTGASDVEIGGWFLQDEDGATSGIAGGAVLPAGTSAVLIPSDQSVAGFQQAWGTGFDVYPLDQWSTGLSNLANSPSSTNEILTLRDAGGAVIDEVNYDDENGWPSDSPDGPSIYLLPGQLSAAANDMGANWSRSVVGTHGAVANVPTAAFNGSDVGSPGFVDDGQFECSGPGDCDDGVDCTIDACEDGSCQHTASHAFCDNGAFCDGEETCDEELDCQSATPPCDDGVACTDDDCDEIQDSCTNTANHANCDNGDFCDGLETCDDQLGCQNGSDPCPGQFCDEIGDVCADCLNPSHCDDLVDCTADDCQTGSCVHTPNDEFCDNDVYCDGAEFCDLVSDCQNGAEPCPGQLCIEVSMTCVDCVGIADCDDDNVCTLDICEAPNCVFTPRIDGDVDGNGTISLFDLFCVLNIFSDEFEAPCSPSNADLDPCPNGNGTINLLDLFVVLDSFNGEVDCCN